MLAVSGILFGIAVPRLAGVLDGIEVEAAASRVITAHNRARMMAIIRSQPVVLRVDSSQLTIYPQKGGAALWSEPGPTASRVSVTGTPHQFTFSPEGLTLGLSNATLRLTRGASRRTIVISRLGRIRLAR